ncbi:IclR family transcriptional regulator [Rhodococcus sp. OK519]|uniref:IclR family transcriptional regulator n=1 Tax=Rhodococcus sp. OK519 TaxID=2135729 RepID=UPI0015E6CAE3
MTNRDDSPNAVVDRVISVLSAFSGSDALTSSRIAHRTGLPRSSVHRLLQRLVELGIVKRDGFDYRVGLKLFELGSVALAQHDVHQVAMPYMTRLSRATGMSVHLATLSDTDVVYIDEVWTDWAGPLRRGIAQPAHQTACGKILMACLPPDARPSIDFSDVTPKTRYSINSQRDLDRELRGVREAGLATTREEYFLGSMSIAVQIGPFDHASTALSLWGPIERMRQAEIVSHLRQASRAIWSAAQQGPGWERRKSVIRPLPHSSTEHFSRSTNYRPARRENSSSDL